MERADRLYKSDDRMLFGVASGTAEYLGIDPTLARLAWVAAAFVTGGIGVLVYLPPEKASSRSRHRPCKTPKPPPSTTRAQTRNTARRGRAADGYGAT